MKLDKELHELMVDFLVTGREKWMGTPEEFLEAMHLTHNLMTAKMSGGNPDEALLVLSVNELAEMFMAMVDVDLGDYKDFDDLQNRAVVTDGFAETLLTRLNNKESDEVLREVEALNISLTPETQVNLVTSDLWDEALNKKVENYFNSTGAVKNLHQ